MSSLVKYRVHEVAKDFGVPSKVIVEILTQYASAPKNHMQVLEDEELSIIFEYLTQHNQVESIAEIFADTAKTEAPAPQKQSKSPAGGEKKPAQSEPVAAPQPPKQPKPEKPHVPRQMPEKKVVDTRGSAATNLSKYDERFDRRKKMQKKYLQIMLC